LAKGDCDIARFNVVYKGNLVDIFYNIHQVAAHAAKSVLAPRGVLWTQLMTGLPEAKVVKKVKAG